MASAAALALHSTSRSPAASQQRSAQGQSTGRCHSSKRSPSRLWLTTRGLGYRLCCLCIGAGPPRLLACAAAVSAHHSAICASTSVSYRAGASVSHTSRLFASAPSAACIGAAVRWSYAALTTDQPQPLPTSPTARTAEGPRHPHTGTHPIRPPHPHLTSPCSLCPILLLPCTSSLPLLPCHQPLPHLPTPRASLPRCAGAVPGSKPAVHQCHSGESEPGQAGRCDGVSDQAAAEPPLPQLAGRSAHAAASTAEPAIPHTAEQQMTAAQRRTIHETIQQRLY